MSYYKESLDTNQQITIEEDIAFYLFEETEISEVDAQRMSQHILKLVLTEFRPDLLEKE